MKNISHDAFGTKLGRVHMQRQDFSKLQLRKVKALKKSHEEMTEDMDVQESTAEMIEDSS